MFKSYFLKAKSREVDASKKGKHYQYRPALELYQMTKDLTEQNKISKESRAHIKSELLKS